MTAAEKLALQKRNAEQMAQMDINAAGMIQSLLLDLNSNGTFIGLTNPASHKVDYVLVAGNAEHVTILGDELGLIITADNIEVPQ